MASVEDVKEACGEKVVAFRPALAAVAGGAVPGLFLSQALFMQEMVGPDESWFHTRHQWTAELGLTRPQQETARRELRGRGFLDEELRGLPRRVWFRVRLERVAEALARAPSAGEGAAQEAGNQPGSRPETSQQGATLLADGSPSGWSGSSRQDGSSAACIESRNRVPKEKAREVATAFEAEVADLAAEYLALGEDHEDAYSMARQETLEGMPWEEARAAEVEREEWLQAQDPGAAKEAGFTEAEWWDSWGGPPT
ncbi:MAG: hypothetical protein ACQEXJ_23785 [Myxococcota bacterium]